MGLSRVCLKMGYTSQWPSEIRGPHMTSHDLTARISEFPAGRVVTSCHLGRFFFFLNGKSTIYSQVISKVISKDYIQKLHHEK